MPHIYAGSRAEEHTMSEQEQRFEDAEVYEPTPTPTVAVPSSIGAQPESGPQETAAAPRPIRVVRGALAAWWLLLSVRIKILTVLIAGMLLLVVVTLVPTLIGVVIGQPVAWPFIALLVAWLVARRRSDRPRLFTYTRRLLTVARLNQHKLLVATIAGAGAGMVLTVPPIFTTSGSTPLDALYTTLMVITVVIVVTAAVLERRTGGAR